MGEPILARFSRIVGHGYRADVDATDRECLLTVKMPQAVGFLEAATAVGSVREVNRDLEIPGQHRNTGTVVCVFVSHQNAIDLCGVYSQSSQAPDGFAHRETAIDHDQRIARFHKG